MLLVDANKRASAEDLMNHPWQKNHALDCSKYEAIDLTANLPQLRQYNMRRKWKKVQYAVLFADKIKFTFKSSNTDGAHISEDNGVHDEENSVVLDEQHEQQE